MSRHEDAMAIMLDPVTFSSDKGGGRTAGGTGLHDEYQAGKFLNWTDDPRHKRLRGLVNKGFTNRAIHDLEAELRRRTVALIEALPENEPFDFVERFSRDLRCKRSACCSECHKETARSLRHGLTPVSPHQRRRLLPETMRGACVTTPPA